MQKEKRNNQSYEDVSMTHHSHAALSVEENTKSKSGFLYQLVARAKHAFVDKGVLQLQSLSDLIESEIMELQKEKRKFRLRDALRSK